MTRREILQQLEACQQIQQRNPPTSAKWKEASDNIRHLARQLKPFNIGDRVTWSGDSGKTREGVVYRVEFIDQGDGWWWKVGASWNGEPYHPISNSKGPTLVASARKFQPVIESEYCAHCRRSVDRDSEKLEFSDDGHILHAHCAEELRAEGQLPAKEVR